VRETFAKRLVERRRSTLVSAVLTDGRTLRRGHGDCNQESKYGLKALSAFAVKHQAMTYLVPAVTVFTPWS
jgi:hypothetical protein